MKKKSTNKLLVTIVLLVAVLASIKVISNLNNKKNNDDEVMNLSQKEMISIKPESKVIVYVKNTCSYCTMTKDLLDKKDIPYEVVELTNNNELFIKLSEENNYNTVPMIFIDDKFIGGYMELLEIVSSKN